MPNFNIKELIEIGKTISLFLFSSIFGFWLNYHLHLKQKDFEFKNNSWKDFNTSFWEYYCVLKKYSSDITIPFSNLAYKKSDMNKEIFEAEKKYITIKSNFKNYLRKDDENLLERIDDSLKEIKDLSVTAFIYKSNTLNSVNINHESLLNDKNIANAKLTEIETIYNKLQKRL